MNSVFSGATLLERESTSCFTVGMAVYERAIPIF